jgi:hypothetical protein
MTMEAQTAGESPLTLSFRFTRQELAPLAAQHAEEFRSNQPFPHVVLRDFLPIEVARAIAAEFPGPHAIPWRLAGPGDATHTGDKEIEKISTPNEDIFPPLIRRVMHEFNSGVFVDFLSSLTGFPQLNPDPWFHGCGLHSTGRGGRLMIHADASRHPNPKFQQMINTIYYATPDWQDEWGGHLELWDKTASQKIKTVKPEFNSLIVFFTGSDSYHGHPHPLNSPFGVRRNSLATYFYTTDRQVDEYYGGYKNFVEWKRTNPLDYKVSLYHRLKGLARRHLPISLVNQLASAVRRRR